MINTVKDVFKKRSLLLFSFFCSALILLFCSKSSPIYPMNDWVDVHCFLTLGRGLLHGKIPYVDLYEQKGPVLYFIYAIISLFSGKYMIGQYLFEVFTYGLFLYFSAKLAGLYLGEKSLTLYALIPILGAVVGCTASFTHGGSVEQSALFIFAYGLYSVLKACRENRPLTFREAAVNGLLAGILFWVKYTMVGFYLGLALFVLIWYIAKFRSFQKVMTVIGTFLLGFGMISGVVLLFYLCVGGIDELFTCYFYNNIFLYKEKDPRPFLTVFLNRLNFGLSYNRLVSCFIFTGLGWLVIRSRKHFLEVTAPVLTFAGMVFGIYFGASYAYYSLVLGAYVIFGLIGVISLLKACRCTVLIRRLAGNRRILLSSTILCITLACSLYSVVNSNNIYMLQYDREDLPQYKFAKIINQTEDATVLNFEFLDGGFYYAADIVPNCRYFCSFNAKPPEMWKVQYGHVKRGKADYVITRSAPLTYYHHSFTHYELVSTASMMYEGNEYTFFLYRLKGDAQ